MILTSAVSLSAQAPGFRLWGPMIGNETHLLDTGGNLVHTWQHSARPGLGVYLLPDGDLLRARHVRRHTTTGGSGGALDRISFDGSVTWSFSYDTPAGFSHHDIAPLPNGNVLMIAWEDKTVPEARAAGRNPAFIAGSVFRPDHLIEVQTTGPQAGTIVWRWHVWDHLIQDYDPEGANFGVVADHPELVDINYPLDPAQAPDWNHCNGIDYDPVNDWIVVSAHRQNEIWIIDHSTTTAEAAGHTGGRYGKGGDLLYRWGNPQAYRRGTVASQQLFGQHAPCFIPPGYPGAGNVMVFNNSLVTGSEAWELVLPLDASGRFIEPPPTGFFGPTGPVWSAPAPVSSPIVSNAERLPNGNTLICSGQVGRFSEVDPSGVEVWSHAAQQNVFHAHYVERSLWSDATSLNLGEGGSVQFDLVAGSPRAGETYLVLGSASGTSPGTTVGGLPLPLNPDSYFVLTATMPSVFPLTETIGTLDGAGRASATFGLPPGLSFLAGLHVDHAFLAFDLGSGTTTHASNAVPLDLLP
ncbi:MAG: aryl-sulfate sulfotransferase [Planctomycetota bacterium]